MRFSCVTFAAASSGGRSAFTIFSASARRPAGQPPAPGWPARADRSPRAMGAAQRLLGLRQILRQHVGQPEIGQHRRLFGRDLQRARIILPRFLVPPELIERRALRRQDAPVRIVRAVGAAEHVEGLLEIAVVGQRAAIAGQQRLVAGMGDAWPARAPRPPATAAPWRAAPCRIAAPRRRPWGWRDSAPGRARRRAAGRRRRLASAFSPSEPVMSDSPEVWQPQSPNARIADGQSHARSRATRDGWSNFWSMYLDHGRRLSRNAHSLTLSSG